MTETLNLAEAPSAASVGGEDAAAEHETSLNDRVEQVRKAAYARYKQRGFEGGHEEEDWLSAEAEIDASGSSNQRQG
jgi:hypothetical protein